MSIYPQALPQPITMSQNPGNASVQSVMQATKFGPPTSASPLNGEQWAIVGAETQVLAVVLAPNQELICEPGSMLHSDDGIEASANMGGCTCGACCAGEDIFRTVYANKSQQPRTMTLASPYPGGKLLAVTLTPSGLTLSKGVWSATLGTHEFEVKVAKNLTAGCCAGQGLILSVIKGNGTAFLSGGGTVFQRTLAPQEKIMIDTSSLVACDNTVDIGVRRAGSAMMMCCGGEGLFVWPGLVIIQSMPVAKAAMIYYKYQPKPGGGAGGGGDGGGGGGGGSS